MPDGHATVAHHFEDAEQEQEANILGMWLFLTTEVLFFGGLFAAYAVYRYSYPAVFVEAGLQLDVVLGSVNTLILLGSSLTMALAVHAVQTDQRKQSVIFLVATVALALIFLGVKAVEYTEKFEKNLAPGASFVYEGTVNPRYAELFYSLYFAMTGLHALHVIIGIFVLALLAVMAWRGRFSSHNFLPVELTGLYWHFVDVVWIFLFPLLYLIER